MIALGAAIFGMGVLFGASIVRSTYQSIFNRDIKDDITDAPRVQ